MFSTRTWILAMICAAALAPITTATASGSVPAPVFHPVVAQLSHSRIPVFLPSWLPHFEQAVYPVVTISQHRRAYEVDLSYVPHEVGTATLAFYLTANIDGLSPGPHPSRVVLGHRLVGYVGAVPGTAGDSLTIRWRRNGIVYVIGRLGNERLLVRTARAMVRVPSMPGRDT